MFIDLDVSGINHQINVLSFVVTDCNWMVLEVHCGLLCILLPSQRFWIISQIHCFQPPIVIEGSSQFSLSQSLFVTSM